MKKSAFILFLIPAVIFAAILAGPVAEVACAAPSGHFEGGHGGGFHGGGGHFGGRGFGGHEGHFRGGGHFEGGIWFWPGFWDPFYYPYYTYPYYAPPTVVEPEQPEEYIMPTPQAGETGYWYYCKDANGYYPYVKSCPGGWLRVVPSPAPPNP